jgi:MFS family permease
MTTPNKLLNKNFFLLWQGQLVSQIGNQVHYIAMMFWIKHATGSASLMGLIMMFSMLPGVILGPIGGTIADMYSRKRIIVIGDFINGIIVLCLAAVLIFVPDNHSLIITLLFVVAVLSGIIGAFFRPAISASIPDLVPQDKIPAANSMNQSSFQISTFFGQGIGGVLYRLLGPATLFIVDGLTYLFSSLSESFIDIPQKTTKTGEGIKAKYNQFISDIKEGFAFVWKNKGMRALFFSAAFLNFFLSPIGVLLPFYVEDFLNVNSDWFGFILAAFGAGALIGYLIAGAIKISGHKRTFLTTSLLFLVGLAFGWLGMNRSPYIALVIEFITGMMIGVININIITIMQITTPSEIRGRVFGILGTISGGLYPLGAGLTGVIAELTGNNVPAIYMTCGVITAALTLIVSTSHNFREFLAYEPEK